TLHPVGATLTGRASPTNSLEAQVSVPHWTAAAFIRRAAGIPEGEDACVCDPAVLALRERVRVIGEPTMAPPECRMVVTLSDGARLESHIPFCRGSHERPLTDQELGRKFLAQAVPVLGEAEAAALLARCWDIEAMPDIRPLIAASATRSAS